MTAQPDLGLVSLMLDDYRTCGEAGYTINAIREQARLCREAENAAAASVGTVKREGGLPELPTPAHPTHSLGPLYSAAQMRWYGEQVRRLATPEQPGSSASRPFAWYRPTADGDQEPEFRTTAPPAGHGWLPVPGSAVQGDAVAWRVTDENGVPRLVPATRDDRWLDEYRSTPGCTVTPLYTTPPPAPAAEQGATDERGRPLTYWGGLGTQPEAREEAAVKLGCADCGLPYGSERWADFVVPDDAWLKISPTGHEGGVLCVQCMLDRAVRAGVECVGKFTSGPFVDSAWRKPEARGVEGITEAMRSEMHAVVERAGGYRIGLLDEMYRAALAATPNPVRAEQPEVQGEDEDAIPEVVVREQAGHLHPVTQVFFRAGLIACREYMARFVEAESPTIAASIRANWWPDLGPDLGPPRKINWNEVTDGEYGESSFRVRTKDEVSPTLEALPVALQFLERNTNPPPAPAAEQGYTACQCGEPERGGHAVWCPQRTQPEARGVEGMGRERIDYVVGKLHKHAAKADARRRAKTGHSDGVPSHTAMLVSETIDLIRSLRGEK